MSNLTRTAHPDLLNRFKSNLTSGGYTFHGVLFGYTPQLAQTYQETVTLLVTKYGSKCGISERAKEELKSIDELRKKVGYGHDGSLYKRL